MASSWTRRHANAAGLGQAFKAGDDVDAVADDVAVLGDDVAHMVDDAELDPPIRRQRAIAFSQGRLHFGRAAKRFDDAAELDEQPVAGGLDETAPMLCDFRIEELAAQRPEALQGAAFIGADQPRIARNIGRGDRGKSAGCGYSSGIPALRSPSV